MNAKPEARRELEKQLAALRVAYAEKLPGKFTELRRLASQAKASGTPESAEEFQRCAHTLAGTAGSYGLDAVSEAARQLESLIVESTDDRNEEAMARLEAAVDRLFLTRPG